MNFVTHNKAFRVGVVGGGISGLASAFSLMEEAKRQGLNLDIFLLESSQRLGGKIKTEKVDGFTIEGGPDCYLRQKPWASQLAATIGIENEIIGTNDDQRKIFVVDKGNLVPLPDGVMLIVPTRMLPFALSRLISIPAKIRMGLDVIVPPFKGEGDESIGDFVRRRLGQEALDKIAEPLLSGIHVSSPEDQSLLATFPRFRTLEQKHGSLIKGMLAERKFAAGRKSAGVNGSSSIFLSFREGLGRLVARLEALLQGVHILRRTSVTRIEKLPQGGFTLFLSGQTPLDVDVVILAVPAYNAAMLINSFAPGIASSLNRIRYVSTATISLAYRKADLQKPYSGFGFVVPSKEKRDISACTWTSLKFDYRAPEDMLLVRCFMGGPGKEEQVSLTDEEMIRIVRSELHNLMGLSADPQLTRIFRWEKANPQYDVGHLTLVRQIHTQCDEVAGLFLTGSAYEGVGIPDCIRQGYQAAQKGLAFLLEKNGSR